MTNNSSEDKHERPKPDWDAYYRAREDLLRRLLSNNENFDRAILTLSSAVLAASLAWISHLRGACCQPVLVASWMFLMVAIGSTLVSYFVSQAGVRQQLEGAKRYFLEGDDGGQRAARSYDFANSVLAYIAAACFAAGITLAMLFAGSNLSSKEPVVNSEENRAQNQKVKGGASLPHLAPRQTDERAASIPDLAPRQPQGADRAGGSTPAASETKATPSPPPTPPSDS